MDTVLEELLSLASRPIDDAIEHDLYRCLQRAAQTLGFDHFSFGHQQSLPMSSPRLTWLSSYPKTWKRLYLDQGHVHTDPRIERARQAPDPFVWDEALFTQSPELWQMLKEHGLHHGLTTSVLNHPPGVSMLSLVRLEKPVNVQEVAQKSQGLQRLAQLAHVVQGRLTCHRQAQELPALSAREIEVLQWSADGKSAQDIAEILGISKNTVDFHIKNAVQKLNAPNKTAAVMRAALLGLLR